jgi:hypothetical protein
VCARARVRVLVRVRACAVCVRVLCVRAVCVCVCVCAVCAVSVCCGTDCSDGDSDRRGFRHEMKRHKATSPNAILRRVRQWREEDTAACKKAIWSATPRSHTRRPDPTVGVLRPQSQATCKKAHSIVEACLTGVCRRILHNYRNQHPYQLQTVHALSDRNEELRLQFCRIFTEY